MELEIFCDGGARGNPGTAAIGVVITGKKKLSQFIGETTNNQAEYQAVIHALQWLVENIASFPEKPEEIKLFLDSNLVVNQLNGRFKVKNSDLRELQLSVRGLENQIEVPVSYHHVSRQENKEADKLVNEVLDNV